jgi:hypothetical protein
LQLSQGNRYWDGGAWGFVERYEDRLATPHELCRSVWVIENPARAAEALVALGGLVLVYELKVHPKALFEAGNLDAQQRAIASLPRRGNSSTGWM